MKTGRNLIISAILSLSAAGAVAPAVMTAPAVTAVAASGQVNPAYLYHG